MPLFRKEALEYRAHRLHGQISLAVPLAWHVIGLALLAAFITALLFLALASFSRIETASGIVVLDRGVAPIVPSRSGTVLAVRARDGQTVRAGAPLIEIRASETLTTGSTTAERILDAMRRQETGLARQSAQLMSAAAAERARLAAQISGLRQELLSLDHQIGVQRELVTSAAREIELVQDVAKRGYISRRDLLTREETLLARRQQMDELDRLRADKVAALTETQHAMEQIGAEAGAKSAELASSRAELEQRRVDAQAGEGYILTAPITGTVTAITVHQGQTVDAQQALMTVIPSNAVLRAELYVPTSAAGFLATGQEVRLAVDSRVETVSGTTMLDRGTVGRHDADAPQNADLADLARDRFFVDAARGGSGNIALEGQRESLGALVEAGVVRDAASVIVCPTGSSAILPKTIPRACAATAIITSDVAAYLTISPAPITTLGLSHTLGGKGQGGHHEKRGI